ncbi:uncharacterized protein [Battus philenor]|uniref:uncharacterized protein n=1 Tax=Battus philenor TaxID=42288 RepID=UPI0035CEEE23
MKSSTQIEPYEEEDDDYALLEDSNIRWSNLLFLPFHPVFKFMVLLSVIVKSIFGPLQSVYPIVYCWDVLDHDIYLCLIKYFYVYCSDLIYGIDTCLHIMHRQVTDEAMRREFLPKSAFKLLIDILCLIPFFRLMIHVVCSDIEMWPNILSFIEFVTIYRVAEYFSLLTTHDYIKLCAGFTIMYIITVNCITCFLMLLTYIGLCDTCDTDSNYKDWRKFIMYKLEGNNEIFSTYIYAAAFIFSFPVNNMFDEIKASTLKEYFLFIILMIFFYLLATFIIFPKIISEALMKLRPIYSFYPRVHIIISETERRNPSSKAYVDVYNFYALVWKKHGGITRIPNIITELPRYLRVDIKQDLVWSVFHHSPTLRRTSNPYQRWLCDYIHMDYKLPGSKFFVGPYCQTHLYYIKSGIVQLISRDDDITPILSVTSGTIFGDVSFFLPPMKHKVIVRCLTYCEVLYLTRGDILKSLHKFPEDRKIILERVKNKIKHAHTLYTCKDHVRGLDRAEDEGIAWIKKRWWEISNVVSRWKTKEQHSKACLKIPGEEVVYHCSKYIGQLVLCTDSELTRNSLFASVNFPLILVPHSSFSVVWNTIVAITVFLVLILYPPNITKTVVPVWFNFFQLWADFIYVSDVCVSLITSMENQETMCVNFASVMFARSKSVPFFIDVLSATWFESLMILIGKPEYYYIVQFNRLLKVYVLFSNWTFGRDPLLHVITKVCLIHFVFGYVSSYITYAAVKIIPELNASKFFGEKYCYKKNSVNVCTFDNTHTYEVFISWLLEFIFADYPPLNLPDVYMSTVFMYAGFLIFLYCKAALIGVYHANNTGVSNYQYFAINITKHYKQFKIHPDLLKRLHRYLICHWKYYKGIDVLYPNLLQNEPYDIYWKVHGEVAENLIRESRPFSFAESALIRDLAYHAKFIIVPKKSALIIFGLQPKNVTWLVQGYVRGEYHDDKGELIKSFYEPGDMMAFTSVFFNKPSLRTYVAYTECEVLFINRRDFFKIIKRYPREWYHFEVCLEEFRSRFEKITYDNVKKHRDYQKKLRQRIFHSRMSVDEKHAKVRKETAPSLVNRGIYHHHLIIDNFIVSFYRFWKYWMLFRAIIVCISIISASFQGGTGAYWRWPLVMIGAFCDSVSLIDMIIKLFMPYYDQRGLLVTDLRSCMSHYLTRTFIMDAIGALPVYEVYSVVMSKAIEDDDALLVNTLSRFAHIYIVIGYFDYLADNPSANIAYIMIHVQSLNFAQSGLMRFDMGKFEENRKNIGTAFVLFLLGSFFWFVLCYCLTLLVLNFRGNTLYQHGVFQLKRFLEAERVEKDLIDSVQEHFKYVWQRTKGINVQKLMNERIAVAFRQDLSYYFYKSTFEALSTLLGGSEQIERQLATASKQLYFLPGQEILREMDLAPWVYVVHRGRILVKRGGEKLALLTKGAIFGQIEGIKPRPVRISAEAEGYADVLKISIADFQDALTQEIRSNLEQNSQTKLDFMPLKKIIVENPYNTIQYILRGKKAIKLPWMESMIEATDGSWYTRWLFLTWLIQPVITSVVVLTLKTVELVVVEGKCVMRILKYRKLLTWSCYLEIFTIIVPTITFFTGNLLYQLVRLLRLRLLFEFYIYFCTGFQSRVGPVLLKILSVILVLHAMTCGWMIVACRETFPVKVPDIPEYINATIDYTEWVLPKDRKGGGCARMTKTFMEGDKVKFGFIVPRTWGADYIVSLSYVLVMYTCTELESVVSLNIQQVYYKIVINIVIYLLSIWILSIAISAVYTKLYDLYKYDYKVVKLLTFLRHTGLSQTMLQAVADYTKHLWLRQRGNWLPELAQNAPQCLQEDILGALYLYHLKTPPLLRDLPHYFIRQLVARLSRVVIFPGKWIVQEGDIYPCIYFIHEGEVEKWSTDASGEKKMLTLLTTNDYFGFIPGLFPNSPFLFSYVTRTVVDVVFLRYKDWQDLLQGYPKVKYDLYTAAKLLKKEMGK